MLRRIRDINGRLARPSTNEQRVISEIFRGCRALRSLHRRNSPAQPIPLIAGGFPLQLVTGATASDIDLFLPYQPLIDNDLVIQIIGAATGWHFNSTSLADVETQYVGNHIRGCYRSRPVLSTRDETSEHYVIRLPQELNIIFVDYDQLPAIAGANARERLLSTFDMNVAQLYLAPDHGIFGTEAAQRGLSGCLVEQHIPEVVEDASAPDPFGQVDNSVVQRRTLNMQAQRRIKYSYKFAGLDFDLSWDLQ
jgi:hypothetical protein